jgi:very-short-patch-repair endonuclease
MDIEQELARFGRVASRTQLVEVLGRHRFDNAVKGGRVIAVFPRVYALPWDVDELETRQRGALLSVGGQVALSHLTAIGRRDLPVPLDTPLHVTAYQPRHPRGVPDELVVHRTLRPFQAEVRDDLASVRLETALTTSWPLLTGPAQRAPLVEAKRRRLVTAGRLRSAAEAAWWVRDSRGLRDLVTLILAGCESELELWGYTGVFDVPGLRDATRQRWVAVGDRRYRLDMAYDEQRLDVELDGRAFHASTEQWERDIKRDLALATIGWQTIRLSHARLHADVAGCRRDVLAVRAARRRLIA